MIFLFDYAFPHAECEGTGDLNVEEQFLEWVEENAKCPYCEGSGSVSCDVCLGGRALKSS